MEENKILLSSSESEIISTIQGGIPEERIVNFQKIQLIYDIIKCPICYQLLRNPFECTQCEGLFCDECISSYIKSKKCPNNCQNFEIIKAKLNIKKLLNVVELKCKNHPDCNYIGKYWDMFEHEGKCEFQKLKCPNNPCIYNGKFSDLKKHILENCDYSHFECGFCRAKILRKNFAFHLEEHYNRKSFYILECSNCSSSENLRMCLCKKPICYNCLQDPINRETHKKCYIFKNGLNYTNKTYNISNVPLPKNFEAKIYFKSADWVRTGITFDKSIGDDEIDANCPLYDIYCILEDLVQFYTLNNRWKYLFKKDEERPLKSGDNITIRFQNGELRYYLNGNDLGVRIKIDMSNKNEFYLLIHCRNNNTKAEIVYITEIFD